MRELNKEDFIENLSESYGQWDVNSARFGTNSYGDIADDLCISSSQFSKLLYGSATAGMYERTIKNINRINENKRLNTENLNLKNNLDDISHQLVEGSQQQTFNYKYLILCAVLFSILGYILSSFFNKTETAINTSEEINTHSLSPFFEREFNSEHISPYLNINEIQTFCPGSAFEGTWELAKPYIIPIPAKKPGLYYLAKNSDLKVKCYRNVADEKRGKVFLGFEQMYHEIWIDTSREPLSPKYFNLESKSYTKEFVNLNFEEDPNFKKVADIHSFMFNTFELTEGMITRDAEPSGRYANNINYDLANQFEIDVQDLLENSIGNLVKTYCNSTPNNYCNPNTLIENESVFSFDCNFTIKNENLGIGGSYPYTKGFKLVKQNYSDNLLCDCNE